MAEFAKVTSLDALREFKASIAEFSELAGLALSEAQSDVQRTIWWLQHDQAAHWQREIKKRTEKLNQAKAELFKKQLESNDTRTSAVVERKNVTRAQNALDEADEKLKRVKKWHQLLEREQLLFKAGLGQVAGAVAGDLPVALGRMDKMISSLEAYISIPAPVFGTARTIVDTQPDQPQSATSEAA